MQENRLPEYIDHIQQAVVMRLIIFGEAATFDVDLNVVWETAQEWLPEWLKQLPAVRRDASDEDRSSPERSRVPESL